MLLLTLSHITKYFDDKVIVDDISLAITEGDKIGVVGRNGVGKTTLFEIIAGHMQADSGTVERRRGLSIGFVAQELDEYLDLSLYDFCLLAMPQLNDLRLHLRRLEADLSSDSKPPAEIIEEYQNATLKYEEMGGYRLETEVRLVLEGIGFSRSAFERPLRSFSGGEKNRAQIAAVLVADYDLLLLDEPTNHLDIDATIWLENYIAASPRAFLIISHDRRFLQGTVTKIIEIEAGQLDVYQCRYQEFLAERAKRRELAAHYYRHQQEEIARIEDFIRRNMAGQKTKQAQSKQKYLARMQKMEAPKYDAVGPTFHIHDGGRSFLHVLKVENLSIGYDSAPLVENISFELTRGSRVGLIGPNGAGKTTLLKTLGGLLEPIHGDFTIGGNVDMAYFDQELSNLNHDSNVISELWEIDPLAESGRLRSFLARFGFYGEDVFKPVSLLSGGEKTKLSLAKLLYRPANLMIFDEPTNHLDIASIEALEEGLSDYNGTLVVVSHDRDFLDHTISEVFEIRDHHMNHYLGNYSDYAQRRAANAPDKKVVSEEKKASYEEFKAKSRERSRYKKQLKHVHESITKAEASLKQLESDEAVTDASDWKKLNELREQRYQLEERILNWYIEIEHLEANPPDEQ